MTDRLIPLIAEEDHDMEGGDNDTVDTSTGIHVYTDDVSVTSSFFRKFGWRSCQRARMHKG